jgi:hypothetical protein
VKLELLQSHKFKRRMKTIIFSIRIVYESYFLLIS